MVLREGNHRERLSVLFHVPTCEVVECSPSLRRLLNIQQFVGDIVHGLELWAFLLGVAQVFWIPDLGRLPFVLSNIGPALACFALDGPRGPNVLLSVFADQIAKLLRLLFVRLSSAFRLHPVKVAKLFGKVGAGHVVAKNDMSGFVRLSVGRHRQRCQGENSHRVYCVFSSTRSAKVKKSQKSGVSSCGWTPKKCVKKV